MRRWSIMVALGVGAGMLLGARVALAGTVGWDPRAFARESTLELRTVDAGEGEHWFPVWLVVIDDEVYVRLGSRAARRIEGNPTAPAVGLRVAGRQFDRVRAETAPDRVAQVAEAMAHKYWSDLLIRFFPHPLTLRLVPE